MRLRAFTQLIIQYSDCRIHWGLFMMLWWISRCVELRFIHASSLNEMASSVSIQIHPIKRYAMVAGIRVEYNFLIMRLSGSALLEIINFARRSLLYCKCKHNLIVFTSNKFLFYKMFQSNYICTHDLCHSLSQWLASIILQHLYFRWCSTGRWHWKKTRVKANTLILLMDIIKECTPLMSKINIISRMNLQVWTWLLCHILLCPQAYNHSVSYSFANFSHF